MAAARSQPSPSLPLPPPPDIAGDRAIGDLWSYEQFIASPGPKHYGEGNPPPPSAATLAASKAKAKVIADGGGNEAAWRAALNVLGGSQAANRARMAAARSQPSYSPPQQPYWNDEYGRTYATGSPFQQHAPAPPKPTSANASGSNAEKAKALKWVMFLTGEAPGSPVENILQPYVSELTEAGLSDDPSVRRDKLTSVLHKIAEQLDFDVEDIPKSGINHDKLFSDPMKMRAFGALAGIVIRMLVPSTAAEYSYNHYKGMATVSYPGLRSRSQKVKNAQGEARLAQSRRGETEGNLLGLTAQPANDKDLLTMPTNAQNLESLFKGGTRRNKRRSRKHKRKSRKNRKTSRR